MSEPLSKSAVSADNSGHLTELEMSVLEFESKWWKYAGTKESSIRELFDLTPARYAELLNSLIDREEALAASPMLIKRLRRMREARLEERQSRPIA
jgi:hypothetical protein